jgi:hypothetical protein
MMKGDGSLRVADFHGSSAQYKDFMESFIWRDIENELRAWKKDIRDALEDPDRQFDARTLYSLQGSAEAVGRMLMLPQVIMETLKADVERG